MSSVSTLEIVRGISQAMANSYDGALDEKGEPIKIGLKREEGHPILDSRVMDGFKVKFQGNRLCVHYQADIKLKDVHEKGFESDIEGMISKVKSWLQKEYKKVTGNSLSLTSDGDFEVMTQNTSRVRTWVQAYQWFKIGGVDAEQEKQPGEDSLDPDVKKWLALGGLGDKKPKNVTRKET